MRAWPLLIGVPVAGLLLAVAACVGSDPMPTGGPGVEPDSSSGGSGDGSSGGGGDVDGSSGGDAEVDAGPKCGYAGEACCDGPFAPCREGTTCSPTKECVVNDIWAVGYVFNFATFKHDGVSAHFDGTSWTLGPGLGADTVPWAVWGLAPNDYRATDEHGKIRLLTGSTWQVCGVFGCSAPATTNELYAIYGFSSGDFWVGGVNAMFQCGGSDCVAKTTGLPPSWGQGDFAGTSSTDLWYAQFDKAFHWDGTKWTIHPSIQARAIWARAKNDVWAGDTTLQHFDGTNWSPQYQIAGAPAPGYIYTVTGAATDDVWAIGASSSTAEHASFAAHWNGAAWSLTTLPTGSTDIRAAWAASKNEVYAASVDGGIFKWNGTAWTAMTTPKLADGGAVNATWTAIAGSARPRP